MYSFGCETPNTDGSVQDSIASYYSFQYSTPEGRLYFPQGYSLCSHLLFCSFMVVWGRGFGFGDLDLVFGVMLCIWWDSGPVVWGLLGFLGLRFLHSYHSTCRVLESWHPTVRCWISEEFVCYTQKIVYFFIETDRLYLLFRIIWRKILSFWTDKIDIVLKNGVLICNINTPLIALHSGLHYITAR